MPTLELSSKYIGDRFFMSANELAFAEAHQNTYRLARVFNYNGVNGVVRQT